jgi:hypothetical protein
MAGGFMATIQDAVKKRFNELAEQAQNITMLKGYSQKIADHKLFYTWASSALNLIYGVFGKDSPHYERLYAEINGITNNYISEFHLNACQGLFLGAKSDVDGG